MTTSGSTSIHLPAAESFNLNLSELIGSLSLRTLHELHVSDPFSARALMGTVGFEFDGDLPLCGENGTLLPAVASNLTTAAETLPLHYLCLLDGLAYFQYIAETAGGFCVRDNEIGCIDETRFSEAVATEIGNFVALAKSFDFHAIVISRRVTSLKKYFACE